MYRVAILKKTGHLDSWPVLARDNRFMVEPLCPGCGAALDRLVKKPADLILVDLRSHAEYGLELIRRIRVKGLSVDVIALVPRNDRRIMQRAIRLGVVDCLTDTRDRLRMRQALDRFVYRVQMMKAGNTLSQDEIDNILNGVSREHHALPKGLQETTLALVRKVFERSPESGLSCEDVSAAVGLSRITVQRYLAYLCERGEVMQRMNYYTGGRPSTLYARVRERHHLQMPMRQIV